MGMSHIVVSLSSDKVKGTQNQGSTGVLIKRCSENMQHIYKRTPMLKANLLNSHFGMCFLL